MIKMHNWLIGGKEAYSPPEDQVKVIQGEVYGHPRFPDGHKINTSALIECWSRTAVSKSGTRYVLGRIDPDYRKWLKKEFPNWNWRRPFAKMEK